MEMSGTSAFKQEGGYYVGELSEDGMSYWGLKSPDSHYTIVERPLFGEVPNHTIFKDGNEITKTVDHIITGYSIVPAQPITPDTLQNYGIDFDLTTENKVSVTDNIKFEDGRVEDVTKEGCYINPETAKELIQEIYCPPTEMP